MYRRSTTKYSDRCNGDIYISGEKTWTCWFTFVSLVFLDVTCDIMKWLVFLDVTCDIMKWLVFLDVTCDIMKWLVPFACSTNSSCLWGCGWVE